LFLLLYGVTGIKNNIVIIGVKRWQADVVEFHLWEGIISGFDSSFNFEVELVEVEWFSEEGVSAEFNGFNGEVDFGEDAHHDDGISSAVGT